MKTLNKILSVALAGAVMVGCNDLDTEPQGYYVTPEQKEDVTKADPSMVIAGITGVASTVNQYGSIEDAHIDYGWASVMLMLDNRGTDMIGFDIGYNWYSENNALSDCSINSRISQYTWRNMYNQIFAANAVLSTMDPESDDPTIQFFRAQSLAFRAFDYLQLAQLFQFTYVGHESMPCVPIITNENAAEYAANGGSRATVQEVYDQIMSDINTAIELLSNCGVKPESVIDSKAKRLVSLATAYGIRARVNLVMNKWADAASDAQNAISNFSGAPYSLTEASKPILASMDETAVMWGIAVNEDDRVVTTGICNWPSFIGSFNSNGYCSAGSWRKIAINLYDWIPDTDVRKGWFLNTDSESANLSESWNEYCVEKSMPPYTQVKIAPYKNQLGTTLNANDIPLMRVEEMYLINAEATAMAGNASAGAQILTDFVSSFRNPAYVCVDNTPEAVQNAVWMQRRVELWGEGQSFYDIMRLKKGIDRRGGGWEPQWVYNIPAESNVMRLMIPNSEIEGNKALSAGDNNTSQGQPSPVADE